MHCSPLRYRRCFGDSATTGCRAGAAGAEHHVKHHPVAGVHPSRASSTILQPAGGRRARKAHAGRGARGQPNAGRPGAARVCAGPRLLQIRRVWHRSSRHWIAVDPAVVRQRLEIEAFCPMASREFICALPRAGRGRQRYGGSVSAFCSRRPRGSAASREGLV